MKKQILTALACLFYLSVFSQWTAQTSGTGNAFTSVYFNSPSTGVAVTAGGDIIRTIDGGTTWTLITTAGGSLYSVFYASANNIFACGGGGTLVGSTDGGITWSPKSAGTGTAINCIFFVNADTGYTVTNGGGILKSTSTGNAWIPQTSGSANNLNGIFFVDPNIGYAVGDLGTILKTTNAGATWTAQTSGSGATLNSVYFTDATNGFVCGAGGNMLHTSDGGTNWFSTSSSTGNWLYTVRFVDALHGFASGANGAIIKTFDGGGMWYTQSTGVAYDLNSIYFTDANTGYAVGVNGTILKTTDAGCFAPTVSIGGTSTICVGDSTTLTATGANTYKWDANGGNATTNTTTITPTGAGAVVVSVVGTSIDGCVDTAFINITINSTPTVTISGGNIICTGSTATLTAVGASTYSWSTGNTSSVIVVSPGVTTTYTVSGVSAGCSNTAFQTVTVNPLPSITIGSNSPVCQTQTINFTGTGGITYSWSGPNAFSSTLASPTITNASLPMSGTYTVVGVDANGCSNSANTNVMVNALPGLTTSYSGISCFGACDGSDSAVCATAISYNWIPGGMTTGKISNLCAGVYTVTVTDANGCSSTASTPINQPALLTATISSHTNAACPGVDDGALTVTAVGGTGAYTYSWTPTGGNTATASALAVGIYTATVSDANNCTAAASDTIIHISYPSVVISGPTNLCQGQTGQLTYSITGATAPYTNDWFDYVTWTSYCSADTSLLTPLISGTDTVKLTVTDNTGCITTAYSYIPVGAGDNISGLVKDSLNNPVTNGNVYLFQQKTAHVGVSDTIAIVAIQPNGTYTFTNVFYGDYFILADADTNLAAYKTAIATYYSTSANPAYQWDSASVFTHNTCTGSNLSGYDVKIIQLPGSLSGPGQISGHVSTGAGYGVRLGQGANAPMGAPLKGIDIKLGKNPGGSAAARTSTDSLGDYHFHNVPVGNYKIYVDIPNYGMDSVLAISITSTVSTSSNNNYYVDSLKVRVDTVAAVGIKSVLTVNGTLLVYPNPASNSITVQAQKELGMINIINSLGEVVYKVNTVSSKEKIDISNLPAGIYTLRVQDKFIRILKE
jgi:photosystem II stability/assembly factor-like uncharacterized protein